MTEISPGNLINHELIGLEVEISSAKDPTHENVVGRVVDETRNTILVEKPSGRRARIPKATSTFAFKLPDGRKVLVDGKVIVGRPEERLKKRGRSW
ncbi:MAG: ribonuclease P protein component 1 [Candidatus Bathyarchaeia archaeon]